MGLSSAMTDFFFVSPFASASARRSMSVSSKSSCGFLYPVVIVGDGSTAGNPDVGGVFVSRRVPEEVEVGAAVAAPLPGVPVLVPVVDIAALVLPVSGVDEVAVVGAVPDAVAALDVVADLCIEVGGGLDDMVGKMPMEVGTAGMSDTASAACGIAGNGIDGAVVVVVLVVVEVVVVVVGPSVVVVRNIVVAVVGMVD